MITPENAKSALEKFANRDFKSVSYYQKVFLISLTSAVRVNITLPNMYVTSVIGDVTFSRNSLTYSLLSAAGPFSTTINERFSSCCSNQLSIYPGGTGTAVICVCGYSTDEN